MYRSLGPVHVRYPGVGFLTLFGVLIRLTFSRSAGIGRKPPSCFTMRHAASQKPDEPFRFFF